jgi:hypothetical protein
MWCIPKPKSRLSLYAQIVLFVLLYLVILGAIAIGFYCWYMDYYCKLEETNERPVIVGFGADVEKKIHSNQVFTFVARFTL